MTERIVGRFGASALGLLLAVAGPAIAQEAVSPYAGEEGRTIKALSAEQIADLEAGKGMGYAMAAELNHYPGPRHVLDMADALGLDAETIRKTEALFDAMQTAARKFGERIIEAERQLDQAFVERTIAETRLTELTRRIAELEGELRNIHLAAHLEMTRLLTPKQIHAYDQMRGYGGGETHEHDPSGHSEG